MAVGDVEGIKNGLAEGWPRKIKVKDLLAPVAAKTSPNEQTTKLLFVRFLILLSKNSTACNFAYEFLWTGTMDCSSPYEVIGFGIAVRGKFYSQFANYIVIG